MGNCPSPLVERTGRKPERDEGRSALCLANGAHLHGGFLGEGDEAKVHGGLRECDRPKVLHRGQLISIIRTRHFASPSGLAGSEQALRREQE